MRALILLLSFPALALAQSMEQGKSKEPTAPQQSKSSILDKGTEQAPLVVRIENPPGQKEEASEDEKEHNETSFGLTIKVIKKSFTTIEGWGFWAMVVQSFLLWWTIATMRKSDERQLRAYVSVWIKNIFIRTNRHSLGFDFVAMNHGGTPAKELGFRAQRWHVAGDIPADYRPDAIRGPWNVERGNTFPHASRDDAEKMSIGCDLGIPIPIDEHDALLARRAVWILGLEIQYWDVFTPKKHITREYFRIFCELDNVTNETKVKVSVVPRGSFVS